MSESENPTAENQSAEPAQQDGTDWKAEARKWEARAKANLSELEQARTSLTSAEAAAQQAQQAASELEAQLAQVSALRSKEALLVDAGLPRDLADNIVGDDEDAWKASVERFAALRGEVRQERMPDPAQQATNAPDDPNKEAAAFFDALLRK